MTTAQFQDNDIYSTIVAASKAINTLVQREGKRKFPDCVHEIQLDLIGQTIAADVVPVMKRYIERAK